MSRIKNLKYDPNHANKPMRGYCHLEYLDKVFTLTQARNIEAFERKRYGRPVSLIVEPIQEKPKKAKRNDS